MRTGTAKSRPKTDIRKSRNCRWAARMELSSPTHYSSITSDRADPAVTHADLAEFPVRRLILNISLKSPAAQSADFGDTTTAAIIEAELSEPHASIIEIRRSRGQAPTANLAVDFDAAAEARSHLNSPVRTRRNAPSFLPIPASASHFSRGQNSTVNPAPNRNRNVFAWWQVGVVRWRDRLNVVFRVILLNLYLFVPICRGGRLPRSLFISCAAID